MSHDTGSIQMATFAPDGKRVLTSGWDSTARLWDAATGNQLLVLRHDGPVFASCFSPNGERVLTGSRDHTARIWGIWDASTGVPVLTLKGHTDMVLTAVFSSDGQRILTASEDNTARLWDAETGDQLLMLKGSGRSGAVVMFDASFSPDGLRILTIDGMNARIWGAEMGNRLLQLRMPPGGTPIGVFSPDNRRVVTAGTGDSLTIWDGNSGKALRTLQSGNAILTAAFSPNGQYLLTAGLDAPAIYRIVLDKDDVNRISF